MKESGDMLLNLAANRTVVVVHINLENSQLARLESAAALLEVHIASDPRYRASANEWPLPGVRIQDSGFRNHEAVARRLSHELPGIHFRAGKT